MKHVITGLALTGMLAAVGCSQERTLGYCGQGDTCRYDLKEPELVRTYSGFLPPANTKLADVETEARDVPTEAASPNVTDPQSSANVTLVRLSN